MNSAAPTASSSATRMVGCINPPKKDRWSTCRPQGLRPRIGRDRGVGAGTYPVGGASAPERRAETPNPANGTYWGLVLTATGVVVPRGFDRGMCCAGCRERASDPGRNGHPELLGGHPGALDAVRDLLERDVPGVVGRAVQGLLVDRERREPAVVRRAEELDGDVARSPLELVAHLLRRLDAGVLRVDHSDEG